MNTPSRDLHLANDAIEKMTATTSFQEFERHWQDFLFRLERAWEAAQGMAKTQKGRDVQSWMSAHLSLRKKDSLLRFLKHARDAETHVVGPTVENVMQVSLSDRFRRRFTIESVEMSVTDRVLTIDIKTPDGHIDWQPVIEPGDPRLMRFKTRGCWYNPPTEHLGRRLDDIHPIAVAMLGHEYYKAAVATLSAS